MNYMTGPYFNTLQYVKENSRVDPLQALLQAAQVGFSVYKDIKADRRADKYTEYAGQRLGPEIDAIKAGIGQTKMITDQGNLNTQVNKENHEFSKEDRLLKKEQQARDEAMYSFEIAKQFPDMPPVMVEAIVGAKYGRTPAPEWQQWATSPEGKDYYSKEKAEQDYLRFNQRKGWSDNTNHNFGTSTYFNFTQGYNPLNDPGAEYWNVKKSNHPGDAPKALAQGTTDFSGTSATKDQLIARRNSHLSGVNAEYGVSTSAELREKAAELRKSSSGGGEGTPSTNAERAMLMERAADFIDSINAAISVAPSAVGK